MCVCVCVHVCMYTCEREGENRYSESELVDRDLGINGKSFGRSLRDGGGGAEGSQNRSVRVRGSG